MNMKEFAEHVGIPYTTLYSILERGVGRASIDNVLKICRALGITAEDLEQMAEGREVDSYANRLSDEELLTIAAHRIGYEGELTEQEINQIKKAIRIALDKD